MDKKLRKPINVQTLEERGDLRKPNTSKQNNNETNIKADRGDAIVNTNPRHQAILSQLEEIYKPNYLTKKEEAKRNDNIIKESVKKTTTEDTKPALKKERKTKEYIKTYLDLEGRRRLRERYTIKLNNSVKSDIKTEKSKESQSEKKSSDGESIPLTKCTEQAPTSKPVIRIYTNENNRYKDVSFVEQKIQTPLNIKIPKTLNKKMKSIGIEVNLKPKETSKVCVVEKRPMKQKKKLRKRVVSPEVAKNNKSPPTEVAKWAPSCLNNVTKPYYEAWINTTLTAISQYSNKERNAILNNLENVGPTRPHTPELFYEDYAVNQQCLGHIRVRQR